MLLKNAVAMAAMCNLVKPARTLRRSLYTQEITWTFALKVEMLTYIVSAENAPSLLRELQAYLRSSSQEFVALTIRAGWSICCILEVANSRFASDRC